MVVGMHLRKSFGRFLLTEESMEEQAVHSDVSTSTVL